MVSPTVKLAQGTCRWGCLRPSPLHDHLCRRMTTQCAKLGDYFDSTMACWISDSVFLGRPCVYQHLQLLPRTAMIQGALPLQHRSTTSWLSGVPMVPIASTCPWRKQHGQHESRLCHSRRTLVMPIQASMSPAVSPQSVLHSHFRTCRLSTRLLTPPARIRLVRMPELDMHATR